MTAVPCPDLPRQTAEKELLAVTVGGHEYRPSSATCRSTDVFGLHEPSGADPSAAADRRPDLQGDPVPGWAFCSNVGLDYLTLARSAGTLSGGESQRIRLATQIGSSLMGVLYILDEPSIGLHQRDNDLLLATLKRPAGPGQHPHRGGTR